MRWVIYSLALVLAASGCRSGKPTPATATAKPASAAAARAAKSRAKPTRATVGTPAKPAAPAAPERHYPVVTPIAASLGKVALVNANGRFVVLDFALNPLPAIGQRLNVYRQGQKIAEVKVTGPATNENIVADLVAGEARPGDEARAD